MKQTPNIGRPRDSLSAFRDGALVGDTFPDLEFPVEYGGLNEPVLIEGGGTEILTYPPRGSGPVTLTGEAIGYGGVTYRTATPGQPTDRQHGLVIPTSVQAGDLLLASIVATGQYSQDEQPFYWEGWTPVFWYAWPIGGGFTFMIYQRVARAVDVGKVLLPASPQYEHFVVNQRAWLAHLRAYQCGGIDKVIFPEDGINDRSIMYSADYAAQWQVNFFPYCDIGDDFAFGFRHDEGFFPLFAGSTQVLGGLPWPPLAPANPIPSPELLLGSEDLDNTMLQKLKLWKNKGGAFGVDPATGTNTSPTGFDTHNTPPAGGPGSFAQVISNRGVTPNDLKMASSRVALTLKGGTLTPPTDPTFTPLASAAPGLVGSWDVPSGEGALAIVGGLLTTADPTEVESLPPSSFNGDKYAARWTGAGSFGNNTMCRIHFKAPIRSGEVLQNYAIVANMVDRQKGLAFFFGTAGVGWITDLASFGTVEADVSATRPTPTWGQNPTAVASNRDAYSRSFGLPGILAYPADTPPASPPHPADTNLDIGATEFWLELWRSGTTYQARIYVNDPTIYGPVYTSKHTVGGADPLYGPSIAGFYGFMIDFIGHTDVGVADIKVLSQP